MWQVGFMKGKKKSEVKLERNQRCLHGKKGKEMSKRKVKLKKQKDNFNLSHFL